MAKIVLLLCSAAPQPPDRYLAKLPLTRKLWGGGSWDMGMLGAVKVSTEPPAPRVRKAYPWSIDTVIRFSGDAKPARDWKALQELTEALLDDVGGVMTSTTGRLLFARLPASARGELWRAIEGAIGGDSGAFLDAIDAVTKWNDPVTEEEIFTRLAGVLAELRNAGPYESLAALWTRRFTSAGAWLDNDWIVRTLAQAEQAGVALQGRAREIVDAHHQRSWEEWATSNPPASGVAGAIVGDAAREDRRGHVILSSWCERHVGDDDERAALCEALTRFSADRGPWPESFREALAELIWKSGAEPLPSPGGALHPEDARWVMGQLEARAAEQRRYAEMIAGIAERNAAMLKNMNR